MDLYKKMMIEKAEEENLTPWDGKFKGIKICQTCEKEFEYITSNPYERDYFCSEECRKQARLRTEFCQYCKKVFTYDPQVYKFGTISYCSDKCQEDAFQKVEQERIIKEVAKLPFKYQNLQTDKIELLKQCLNKSLFLWGSAGTGKSVFMASLAKEYIKQNKKIKWLSFPAFIMQLQNAFKENLCYDMAEKVAKWEGILCIDDLGAEKISDWVRQIIYYIINEREERMLQTIITSNLSLSKIDEFIANRISSRIAGLCEVLQFTGKDRRLSK